MGYTEVIRSAEPLLAMGTLWVLWKLFRRMK